MLKSLPETEDICLKMEGQEGGPVWLLGAVHSKVWEQPLRSPSPASSPNKLSKGTGLERSVSPEMLKNSKDSFGVVRSFKWPGPKLSSAFIGNNQDFELGPERDWQPVKL